MLKRCTWWIGWFSLGLALAWTLTARSAEPAPNSACLECHADKELTKTDKSGKEVSVYVDEAKLAASIHGTNTCVSCHADVKSTHPDDEAAVLPVLCASCHQSESATYTASVHSQALREGNATAPGCTDCHGSHDIASPLSPQSTLHRSRLGVTCGECHDDVARELKESVHGRAVARGLREPPVCTDCHSEHSIEKLKTSSPLKIAEELCSRCHASERMNTKYRLPGDRVRTFFQSYHGLAARLGSTTAANCASCHGYHSILPSSDPRSTIHKDNLVTTCGHCHPGATANFVAGRVHFDDMASDDAGSLINRWVRRFYMGLILVVVGLMAVHNALAWRRKILIRLATEPRTHLRMSKNQRWQHSVLLLSFIILALTGFALAYPNSWLALLMGADESIRRWCHRVAGIVLLGAGSYHLLYLAITHDGRRLLQDLSPRPSDLKDLATNLRFFIRPQQPRPKLDRFGYAEKIEYWAVLWGTVIMGVTGLIIWFKMHVTQFLPRWTVDIASTVHFYEAILAILAIGVWHLYHVIFDPDVYPMNWAWWDGRVSAEKYREEHPLDPASALSPTPSAPESRSRSDGPTTPPPATAGSL